MNEIDLMMRFVVGSTFFLTLLYFFFRDVIGRSDNILTFLALILNFFLSFVVGVAWFFFVPFLAFCVIIYKSIIILKK